MWRRLRAVKSLITLLVIRESVDLPAGKKVFRRVKSKKISGGGESTESTCEVLVQVVYEDEQGKGVIRARDSGTRRALNIPPPTKANVDYEVSHYWICRLF